jgi:indolepyruvate ferredoxin oxidoreductase beta subunit
MENITTNILIVGVGGQGVLLASELLSETAMKGGYDVKKSEVHGMSQRGGVVSSHIKFGPKVYSPIIPYGQADILISFEVAEALRAIDWMKKEGFLVTASTRLVPPIATGGKFHYPDDPVAELRKKVHRLLVLEAEDIARDLGDVRLVNTILLGSLSTDLEFAESLWQEVIRQRVKEKFVEMNLQAFARGRQLAGSVNKGTA